MSEELRFLMKFRPHAHLALARVEAITRVTIARVANTERHA